MGTVAITDASFAKDVMEAKGPVLVDFWAEWCGPCRQIGPALEEIAEARAGEIKITKMNIDENQETPGRYGVRGIPTLLIFNDGELVATKVGAAPKSTLDSWIEDAIEDAKSQSASA